MLVSSIGKLLSGSACNDAFRRNNNSNEYSKCRKPSLQTYEKNNLNNHAKLSENKFSVIA